MGASLQLVAYIDGERFDATEIAHVPWRALVNRPDYEDLVLAECGLRAKRVTSHIGRQYFAHYPSLECPIEHKSESPQHLAVKQALKDRINAPLSFSSCPLTATLNDRALRTLTRSVAICHSSRTSAALAAWL
jgi:hypothetical protein